MLKNLLKWWNLPPHKHHASYILYRNAGHAMLTCLH